MKTIVGRYEPTAKNGLVKDLFGQPALELTMTTRQDDVEGWDSLAHIQLVLALGKRFGVTFTTKDVMGWTDVGSIVRCLEGKLA